MGITYEMILKTNTLFMNRFFMVLWLCVIVSCSLQDNSRNNSKDMADSLSIEEKLTKAREDIHYENDIRGGVMFLDDYLSTMHFEESFFDEYELLASGYALMGEFDKADSILALIDREKLNDENDLFYLNALAAQEFKKGNYHEALELLDKSYNHPGSRNPKEIEDMTHNHGKWLIYSKLDQCDSAKKYVNKYILSLNQAITEYELEGIIDSTHALEFRQFRLRNCPMIDSLSFVPPTFKIQQ